MEKNVGSLDKNIRFVLAIIIIGLGFYYKSWFGVIGIIPLITGLINWCPIYSLFGIKTCKLNK